MTATIPLHIPTLTPNIGLWCSMGCSAQWAAVAKAVQALKGSVHSASGSWCHCLLIQPTEPLAAYLLLPREFPPSYTVPCFSHHHGAHNAAVHKQSGALAKWVLT